MTDPSIREQGYRYFLQEAPELLGILERELLNLRENYSINKVHILMRATHTLKGAAASIGLETIKSVAHSLEDIFKALFNPNVSIDAEVEALLFEGYECLRLPLTATLTGGQINDVEILDRTAAIFALLQEKLGDCFSEEASIPSSIELGFDVTQSIFEVGVAQRLDEIADAVASEDPAVVTNTLRTQAEVFLGLGESLNLPGFTAIAQAALSALDNHPEQALAIGQTALADMRTGQVAVLDGDRTQGGHPSLELQQLAGLIGSSTEYAGQTIESVVELEGTVAEEDFAPTTAAIPTFLAGFEPQEPFIDAQQPSTQPGMDWISSGAGVELNPDISAEYDLSSQSLDPESANRLFEDIWGRLGSEEERVNEPATLEPSNLQPETQIQEPAVTIETRPFRSPQTNQAPPSNPKKDTVSRTVRVNLEHLEQLNYSIGELLTNQNRQSLQNEQLNASVKSLLTRLQNHRQLLGQLQDLSDRRFFDAQDWVMGNRKWGIRNREWGRGKTVSNLHTPIQNRFDSLELDSYSDAQILVQSILEDAVQLAEAAEAIELFATQSNQTLDKQRWLLTSARDSLMEARMLPLGEIFGRFPRLLEQLEILHNKAIELRLQGTEVLVDKVVAEKLYEPLLHLVRNAFDHGIESPAFRVTRGKPEKGQISICAYHQGRYLMIEVRDDGQGLDFEKIRQQAVERQLVDPRRASTLSEAQLTDLLFEPGFSTASGVNELSGRGIGLDVVKIQMQALQGSVTVDSQAHRGTTFALQIPLSLTIAKLLLLQTGERVYALLSDVIEQILIPQADQLRSWDDGKVLRWGQGASEQLIPIYSLANALNYSSPFGESLVPGPHPPVILETPMNPVILIRCQGRLLGLEVDQLLGEQELVIRPLGAMIAPPSFIYGGSILADGRVTLVLDGAALMQHLRGLQVAESNQLSTFHPSAIQPATLQPATDQYLPLLPASKPTALPAAPSSPDFRTRQSKTVLLVDDSITVRQTLAMTLQQFGFQVFQAKDGYEAIEQLQQRTNIQLVLCDIEMPRMNGFEFLKYRQQDSTLARIPVVMLTSRSGEKHRLIAMELGATAYITKPYLEHQLTTTVNEVLGLEARG